MKSGTARATLVIGVIAVLVAFVGVTFDIFTVRSEQGKYELPPNPVVLASGNFGKGFQVGLDTSEHIYGWSTPVGNSICIEYPGAHSWGVWYVTVGQPVSERDKRLFMDFSKYSALSVELKGQDGAPVHIALKARADLDDGNEPRHTVHLRGDDWNAYEIDLKSFGGTDLSSLYVVTSLVFGTEPQTLYVRNIRFK